MTRMETCLVLDSLTKRYGRTLAVDALSLEVRRGEVLGLLGRNGAGKSTTIGMLCGLVRRTSGRVEIFGLDLDRHFLEIAGRTGVLVERPAFHEHLTVRRVLKLHALLSGRGISPDWALKTTGLEHAAGMKVGTLSQGMRQRLGIAQAILTEPELLVLDEPTSGLDVEGTRETLRFLRRLADDVGVTIIFSSHQMGEVEALCDRVAILNRGRLVACEEKSSLRPWDLSRLEVLCDRPEEAAALLLREAWVLSAEANAAGMRLALDGDRAGEVAALLVGAGVRVSGLMPLRLTLEDYFLKVTAP